MPRSGRKLLVNRRFRHRTWQWVGLTIRAVRNLLVDLAALSFWLVVAIIIIQEASRDSIEIEPIETPAHLAEAGYTSTVIANRLMDDILHIEFAAKTKMKKRTIDYNR